MKPVKISIQDTKTKKAYELSVLPWMIENEVYGFDIDIFNSTVRYFGKKDTRPVTQFDLWILEAEHLLEIEYLTQKEVG